MKQQFLTRREATAVMASTLGACFVPAGLFAAEKRSLDDWIVGRSIRAFEPLENLRLDATNEAGFRCLELSACGPNADNWAPEKQADWHGTFDEKTRKLGLTVRSVHIPFGRRWDVSDLDEKIRQNAIEGCAKFFDLKDVYGSKIFVLHPSYEPIKPADRPQRVEKCIESLKVLAPIAKEKGVCLAVENLPRTCLGNTAAETIQLVDAAGDSESIRICFDSNHTLQEKPEKFVAACGKRIVTTHMSDFDGIDEKHWLPYEGVVNWKAVMEELVKTNYPGPFVFETARFKDRGASPKEIFENWLRVKAEYEKG